jgi:hypothetical protein
LSSPNIKNICLYASKQVQELEVENLLKQYTSQNQDDQYKAFHRVHTAIQNEYDLEFPSILQSSDDFLAAYEATNNADLSQNDKIALSNVFNALQQQNNGTNIINALGFVRQTINGEPVTDQDVQSLLSDLGVNEDIVENTIKTINRVNNQVYKDDFCPDHFKINYFHSLNLKDLLVSIREKEITPLAHISSDDLEALLNSPDTLSPEKTDPNRVFNYLNTAEILDDFGMLLKAPHKLAQALNDASNENKVFPNSAIPNGLIHQAIIRKLENCKPVVVAKLETGVFINILKLGDKANAKRIEAKKQDKLDQEKEIQIAEAQAQKRAMIDRAQRNRR